MKDQTEEKEFPSEAEGIPQDNAVVKWWKSRKHKARRKAQMTGLKMVRALQIKDRTAEEKTPMESGAERDAAQLFRKMLKDPHAEVFVSPKVGKCYIRNVKKSRLLILSKRNMRIFNHVYSQDISLGEKVVDSLEEIFLTEVERRRQAMEDEYQGNVRHSIKTLIIEVEEENTERELEDGGQ